MDKETIFHCNACTSVAPITNGLETEYTNKKPVDIVYRLIFTWREHKDLNPEPTVLETATLPIELYSQK